MSIADEAKIAIAEPSATDLLSLMVTSVVMKRFIPAELPTLFNVVKLWWIRALFRPMSR
jgi:hypothetical protein